MAQSDPNLPPALNDDQRRSLARAYAVLLEWSRAKREQAAQQQRAA